MISIIVPAYNAARWLPAAVSSVVTQTDPDWELILVDDGSKDNTGALCDSIAAADRRIRVLHTPNGGLSAARNRGIDAAQGEWLTFLDADDLLHPRFLEFMLRAALRSGADIAACDPIEFHTDSLSFPILNPDNVNEEVMETMTVIEETMYQTGPILPSAWAKLYASSIFRKLRFTEGTWYEDLDLFHRLALECRRIVYVNTAMYGYRQHGNSFLHRFTPGRCDALSVTERMEQWAAERQPELLRAARDRRMSANFNIFLLSEGARRRGEIDDSTADKIQKSCFEQITRLRGMSLMNSKVRLRNRMGALVSYMGPCLLRSLYRLL